MSAQSVALFSPNVSAEIWGCITASLVFYDRYNLSTTCKLMWVIVKAIPYPEFYSIDTSKNVLESFHHDTLTSIRINGAVIDLTSISLTEKLATRIILCISCLYQPYSIALYVKGSEVDCFKNAKSYMRDRGVILQSKRLLADEEGDNSELKEEANLAEVRKRRMRTPSPLRDDVADRREQIVKMKQTFGAINDNPHPVVSKAIKALVSKNQYVDMRSLFRSDSQQEDLVDTDTANQVVQSLAPRFLESIARSSEGSYIFITEVEVYLRASPTVDDCANSTITLGFPEKSLFVVEQKREFRNQWLESKVYYKKFEFLVTGCVYGKVNSTEVQAALGASLGKAPINDNYLPLRMLFRNSPQVGASFAGDSQFNNGNLH